MSAACTADFQPLRRRHRRRLHQQLLLRVPVPLIPPVPPPPPPVLQDRRRRQDWRRHRQLRHWSPQHQHAPTVLRRHRPLPSVAAAAAAAAAAALRPRLPLRAEAVAAEAATAEAAEAAEAAATPAPVLRQTLPHPHSNYPPVLQKRRPRPQRPPPRPQRPPPPLPPPPLPPPPRRPHQQHQANSESGVYLTRPLRPHFDRCLIRRHHWTLPARLPLRMTVREKMPHSLQSLSDPRSNQSDALARRVRASAEVLVPIELDSQRPPDTCGRCRHCLATSRGCFCGSRPVPRPSSHRPPGRWARLVSMLPASHGPNGHDAATMESNAV